LQDNGILMFRFPTANSVPINTDASPKEGYTPCRGVVVVSPYVVRNYDDFPVPRCTSAIVRPPPQGGP
jgi:hypothetical protein